MDATLFLALCQQIEFLDRKWDNIGAVEIQSLGRMGGSAGGVAKRLWEHV
jgi:hypothetical protein